MAIRFVVDREVYQAPSLTFNLMGMLGIGHVVSVRGLGFSMAGAFADPDRIAPMFADIDYARAPEADYVVGGRRYGVFVHDFRRVPLEAWLELTGKREIEERDTGPLSPPPAAPPALSEQEFSAAVRQALRDLHRTDRLLANPLARSRLVTSREANASTATAIAALVREAAEVLRSHPRDQKLHRAIDRTFLRPAETQERAAELLGLPFSTYRRHLTQAIERIVAMLWDRELRAARGG